MVNPIHTDTTIMEKSILYSACKFQERIYACELVRLYNTYSTIQYKSNAVSTCISFKTVSVFRQTVRSWWNATLCDILTACSQIHNTTNGLASTLKKNAHQRETTGSSNDSPHVPFQMVTSLKGKNLLPYSIENQNYHIKWPPLKVAFFITTCAIYAMGVTPMHHSPIPCVLSHIYPTKKETHHLELFNSQGDLKC